jgi:tetratricopeptide (TPR) repeat protein
MVGYQPAAPFAAQMEELITAERTSKAVMQRLASSPEDGPANRNAAALYAILGRKDAAISAFRKAERAGAFGPQLGRTANKIGDMHQNEGEPDSAIVWFEVARFYSGENVDTEEYALVSIASCYLMKEQPDKAKAYAQKILDLKGGSGAYRDYARQLLEE